MKARGVAVVHEDSAESIYSSGEFVILTNKFASAVHQVKADESNHAPPIYDDWSWLTSREATDTLQRRMFISPIFLSSPFASACEIGVVFDVSDRKPTLRFLPQYEFPVRNGTGNRFSERQWISTHNLRPTLA